MATNDGLVLHGIIVSYREFISRNEDWEVSDASDNWSGAARHGRLLP